MIEVTIETKKLKIQLNKLLSLAHGALESEDSRDKQNALILIKEGLKYLVEGSDEKYNKQGNINVRINE